MHGGKFVTAGNRKKTVYNWEAVKQLVPDTAYEIFDEKLNIEQFWGNFFSFDFVSYGGQMVTLLREGGFLLFWES